MSEGVWTNNPYTGHFPYSDEFPEVVKDHGRAIHSPANENRREYQPTGRDPEANDHYLGYGD